MKSQYSLYRQLYLREWQVWMAWAGRIKKERTYMDIEIDEHYQGHQGFVNLIDDIGPRPSPKHELTRINKFDGYAPGNLEWKKRIDHSKQRRVRQDPDEFTRHKLLAEESGIDYPTFWGRVKRGWNLLDAATMPPENKPYKSRLT